MSNYNESTINGTRWSRCHMVTIANPIDNSPSITFGEQDVILVDGAILSMVTNKQCRATFDSENGIVPLVNPETGVSLGTSVSHAELYTILFSLYMQTALERDVAESNTVSSVI